MLIPTAPTGFDNCMDTARSRSDMFLPSVTEPSRSLKITKQRAKITFRQKWGRMRDKVGLKFDTNCMIYTVGAIDELHLRDLTIVWTQRVPTGLLHSPFHV